MAEKSSIVPFLVAITPFLSKLIALKSTRCIKESINKESIFSIEKMLGQILFSPPNVAGWAGGQNWIDNASLVFRLNLVNYLFQTTDLKIAKKLEIEALKNQTAIKRLEADFNIKSIVKQLKKEKKSF